MATTATTTAPAWEPPKALTGSQIDSYLADNEGEFRTAYNQNAYGAKDLRDFANMQYTHFGRNEIIGGQRAAGSLQPTASPVDTAKASAGADATNAATASSGIIGTAGGGAGGSTTTATYTNKPAISTEEAAALYREGAQNVANARPDPALAQTREVEAYTQEVDPTKTTQGLLQSMMQSGSPYLDMARRDALDSMAGRGLLNSSIAVGASTDAAIRRAGEIAGADAGIYANQALANQSAKNAIATGNADRFAATSQFNANSANKFAEMSFANTIKMNEMKFGSALGREEMAFANDLDLGKMALQHGYDLEKLDKNTLADLRKMAVGQGYDLDKMSVDQWNVLERMAKTQGYDLDKIRTGAALDIEKMKVADGLELGRMAKQQGYNLDTLAAQYGYDIGRMREGGDIDLKKMAVMFDYDMDKIVKGAELQMASDTINRAWQSQEAELNRAFSASESELGRNFTEKMQTMQNSFLEKGRGAEIALSMGTMYMNSITQIMTDPNMEPATKASQLDGLWRAANSTLSMIGKKTGDSFGEYDKFWTNPS